MEYRPDVIVVIGDWWDMHSLSSYVKPGSREYKELDLSADIDVGNEAFERLIRPMEAEQDRLVANKKKAWNPVKKFLMGNHEQRVEKYVESDPRMEGMVGLDDLKTPGFERHAFLEIVDIDGIFYSHYFANTHSGRPIGGSIDNRLNKIGRSFVQGHEQGFLYGVRQFPGKLTRHGLVAGSFYQHDEAYRGAQGTGEWRGIVVLNEVNDGQYDIMPLSMNYLKGKYEK